MIAVVTCACASTTAALYQPSGTAQPVRAPSRVASSPAETLAAADATRVYRADIGTVSAAFVGDIGNLQSAVNGGDITSAKADLMAAQSDFDAFRLLESRNPVNASTLDELATEVVPGESFAGLHAVERDLWSSRNAATDVAGLAAQAPVAQYLLSRDRLDPEAIGTTAVDELSWVNQMALPGREEQFSHLGVVDITATIRAADQAFSAIEPVGRQVAPALTASVAQRFAVLERAVDSLGPPLRVPDSAVSDRLRRALAQQAARLAPFGTSGSPS